MSIEAFQNSTDQFIANRSQPIWCQYLKIILADIQPEYNLNDSLILSNRAETYYLQRVVEYIFENPNIDLELYIWWEIVEKTMSQTLYTASNPSSTRTESMVTNEKKTIPRSWHCTQTVESQMGMATTFAIAQPNILPVMEQMRKMIGDILFAYTLFAQQFTWMDDETQRFTVTKIRAIKSYVGFPEWIQNADKLDEFYANLSVGESTHLRNLINVREWQMNKKLKSLTSTKDAEWPIKTNEVNAFYSLKHNAMSDYL